VIDIGTQTTRSGFAGEETPRSVVPTAFGYINLPSSHDSSSVVQDGGASTSGDNDNPMAVDAPSDRRTPEGESNLNGNTNGNKRGKVEKRFFMGDQGVNMWREGMEVGSLMRDGISQYQIIPRLQRPRKETKRIADMIFYSRSFHTLLTISVFRLHPHLNPDLHIVTYHPTSDHITVTDPEALPHLLHHTLHTSLSLPSSEPTAHPLLLTEPAWNTRQARELLAEVAFEGEGVPGVYIACSSVLSA
jgi:hypothetical protein